MSIIKIKTIWGLILLFWGVLNSSNVLAQSLESSALLEKDRSKLGQQQNRIANRGDQAEEKNLLNGDRYWQSGQFNRAISVWKQEASNYHSQENKDQEIETLLKIGRGYISLGQFNSAIAELKRAVALAPSDSNLALTQTRLGNAYQGIGKLKQAISYYQSSLEKEMSLSTINNLVEALQSQSKYNLLLAEESRANDSSAKYRLRAKQNRERALKYAQQALALSGNSLSSVRALISWHDVSGKSLPLIQIEQGGTILKNLTPSRKAAFLMLNWTKVDRERRAMWLTEASEIAVMLDDSYLKSYVFLELGYFYQELGDLKLALDYAQQAQLEAQTESATDSLLRAQHLAGQIYQKQGDRETALTAYNQTIASLDLLNQDSVTLDIEQRTNFRIQIEPIYREALKLLLDRPKITKAELAEALAISDKLRLAQLQNYFGEDCFEIEANQKNQNSQTSADAASIDSIILDDRVFFILQLGNGEIHYSQTNIGRHELTKLANQWNKELENTLTWEFRPKSRQFYDLIIKPFESQLEANNLEVLIFVHDGILRNLPMAALFDGEEFLAQKWASVSSIGLNLTSIPAKEENKVAAFGLETDIPGWSKLDNVAEEIQDAQNIIGGSKFLNQQFTVENLSRQLDRKEYSIIHLATHGYFGGTAETSFILAYEQKISALQLENILSQSKQTLELVVLSACETATGSDRAILGLAGVAARSGVKSTLGSFWRVQDDNQSQTIEAFYTYWKNSEYNKATALQKVQIEQIEQYAHPAQWASLALIGDYY